MIDSRYTITKEYCGYPEARYVIRFCGEWVCQEYTYQDALISAEKHNLNRLKV